ncbi:MAG: Rieske 2Fe-2S domain-containing protein [Flavobacteriales bacterium]
MLVLFLSESGCRKNRNLIPFVPVDVYINLNLPQYSSLNNIGGWMYLDGGSKGLLVYRRTTEEIIAYDRHCTYNIENPCGAATVDSNDVTITCHCDGSQYQLYNGTVIKGPASLALHRYQVNFNGTVVHIYN